MFGDDCRAEAIAELIDVKADGVLASLDCSERLRKPYSTTKFGFGEFEQQAELFGAPIAR